MSKLKNTEKNKLTLRIYDWDMDVNVPKGEEQRYVDAARKVSERIEAYVEIYVRQQYVLSGADQFSVPEHYKTDFFFSGSDHPGASAQRNPSESLQKNRSDPDVPAAFPLLGGARRHRNESSLDDGRNRQ